MRIETLKGLGLTLENAMVVAEVTMLCGHLMFAVYMLISIKKRM